MIFEAVKKVAVIMAHPDDEVLGCGGSISRLAREGAMVHILIMATGLTSRGRTNREALSTIKEEAKAAADVLGAISVDFCDFPDNAMDSRPLLDIIKSIEAYLVKIEPDLIITHHSGDINIDHDITQRAVLTAARCLPGTKPIEILSAEVLSSSEYGPAAKPLLRHLYMRLEEEDVSATITALSCYKGEIRNWPHPRSIEALTHQFRLRGAECGSPAAEVFEVLKVVR